MPARENERIEFLFFFFAPIEHGPAERHEMYDTERIIISREIREFIGESPFASLHERSTVNSRDRR